MYMFYIKTTKYNYYTRISFFYKIHLQSIIQKFILHIKIKKN